MSSTTFFLIFIPILAIILLGVNLLFAPHNPYQEKDSVFECGFHSFLGQNRTQFSVSFFIFALLFLLFDLEILLIYPYAVSAHTNGIYGLIIMLVFFIALTLGFVFEVNKNALKIDSRQMFTVKCFFYKLSVLTNTLHSLCIHGIGLAMCTMCTTANKAAAVKRASLLKPLIIPQKAAFASTMANCEHKWQWISDDYISGVLCDFGMPLHNMQTGLANYCVDCFAVACLTCA